MSPARPRRRKTLDTSRNLTSKEHLDQELRQASVGMGPSSVAPLEYQESPPGMPGILRVKSQYESMRQCGLKGTGWCKETRRTEFSTLEVREYPIILGGKVSTSSNCELHVGVAHP